MNEAQATLELPRTRERVYGELLAAADYQQALENVAAEFHLRDIRPLVYFNGHVERIGPDPAPDNLREILREAYARRTALQHELNSLPLR